MTAEGGASASPTVRYLTDDGTLRIGHVGLNVPVTILARRPGGAAAARLEVRGPKVAGETATHQATFDEQDLLFFGKLLGLDGKPVYKSQLSVRLAARNVFGAQQFDTYLVTEPDGGFFVLVPLQARIPVRGATLDLKLTDHDDETRIRGIASWSFDAEDQEDGAALGAMEMGAFDLGTLQLVEPVE